MESVLKNKDLSDKYHHIRRIGDMANIHYIRQKETNGLGDAIRYAKQHVGEEPFALLLGDTIINSVIPVTQQLIDIYEQYHHTVIAVETVPEERVSRFGIIGGKQISDVLWSIDELVEKPAIEKTPSNLAIAGRYILTPEIFKSLEDTSPDKNNDIQLTDALQLLLKKEDIYAYEIEGKRYDLGTVIDYLKTIVDFSLKDKEVSVEFIAYLREVLKK